jgi:hypothetical protein
VLEFPNTSLFLHDSIGTDRKLFLWCFQQTISLRLLKNLQNITKKLAELINSIATKDNLLNIHININKAKSIYHLWKPIPFSGLSGAVY